MKQEGRGAPGSSLLFCQPAPAVRPAPPFCGKKQTVPCAFTGAQLKGQVMNVFGLHTFAIAPTWDLGRMERRIEELKEYGIGLLEVPLLRPEEIDTRASRAFASRWGVELVCSLGLPRALDIVERPDEGLDFLTPAFKVCAGGRSPRLGGVTYGTNGND